MNASGMRMRNPYSNLNGVTDAQLPILVPVLRALLIENPTRDKSKFENSGVVRQILTHRSHMADV